MEHLIGRGDRRRRFGAAHQGVAHMGAAVGTLVMPREAWEQVWIPMLATQRATIHEHVPNPVMP